MRRITFLRLFPLVASAAVTGCFSEEPETTGPDDGDPAATVDMTPQARFAPATVTIRTGESVRWRNTSNFIHTATADPSRAADPDNVQLPQGAEPFDSGDITAGGEFTHTFTVAGRYEYVCLPHEVAGMVGTVIVEE